MKSDSLPTPYDLELLKKINLKSCIDSVVVMMARCMAIVHYCKGYMVEKKWITMLVEVERKKVRLMASLSESNKRIKDKNEELNTPRAKVTHLGKVEKALMTL